MRLVRFDDDRIGVVADGLVHDISGLVDKRWRGTVHAMTDVIERWDTVADAVASTVGSVAPAPVAGVRLRAPLPRPQHVLAAPQNYRPHVAEMVGSRHAPAELRPDQSPRELGFFLKAPGSISGPADAIELPALPGRQFHHEIELGVVLGRAARGIRPEDVADHIFGYVCVLDITLRTEGERQEERTMRKSFETFTPMGPWIVTADEVPDHGKLDLSLWVNGALRQSATTADLIVGIEDLIAQASQVLTLRPGDVYATGTPEGVGPIVAGDTVRASIESVGELELPVVQRAW